MAAPERDVPVGVLRAAAQRLADAEGLRAAARAIGMSASGLQHFLRGTRPYEPTLAKLASWYVRLQAESPGDPPPDASAERAALFLLVRHLPPDQRDALASAIAETVRQEAERRGASPPAWVGALRRAP